jgi:hypothetical protein
VSENNEGYCVPGVEAKLSARLSAGDSNLMCGVVAILDIVGWTIGEYYNVWRGVSVWPIEGLSRRSLSRSMQETVPW